MGTRAGILTGDNFTLYHDYCDDVEGDGFYLHLFGDLAEFEAQAGSVTVRIPGFLWEAMRTIQCMDLAYADRTDEQIVAEVKEFADRRLADCNGDMTSLTVLRGAYVFGLASEPIEEQMKKGIATLTKKREEAREARQNVQAILARR